MTSALIVMDYQNVVCGPGGEFGVKSGLLDHAQSRDVLSRAARCLEAARSVGATTVHVKVAFDDHYNTRLNRTNVFEEFESERLLLNSDDAADFCPEVAPHDGELVVVKGCINPFIGTALEQQLRVRGDRTAPTAQALSSPTLADAPT